MLAIEFGRQTQSNPQPRFPARPSGVRKLPEHSAHHHLVISAISDKQSPREFRSAGSTKLFA
jgi:hypothetical protein